MAARYVLEPDPAWDWSQLDGDVLEVELSWPPDALAGRVDEWTLTVPLADQLAANRLTGFTIGPVRCFYTENSMVAPGLVAPTLLRLIVGGDISADLSYLPPAGLVASQQALDLIREHCSRLQYRPL